MSQTIYPYFLLHNLNLIQLQYLFYHPKKNVSLLNCQPLFHFRFPKATPK